MSAFNEYVKKAVFYSKEKPESLAAVLEGLASPENLTANIAIPAVEVENNTALDTVKATLPTKITAVTSKGIPFEATVTWGSTTTPTYAPTTAGDYVLEGTLSGLPAYVTNTGSNKATVTITVKEA